MRIRLHFAQDGQRVDALGVVSRSPRVIGAARDGHVELTVLPQGLGTWRRSVAAAHARQHRPLLEQVEALAALIDGARRETTSAPASIAAKNAAVLSQARELASSLGDATIATADRGLRRIEHEANESLDRARAVVRRHPLRSVGLAAIAGAIWAGILRR